MSLVRQLAQICMVQAMRGRTLAGPHVLDSNIAGMGAIDFTEDQPVIACSVEESDQNGKHDRGFFGRTSDFKLYVQVAVATKASYRVVSGEGEETVETVTEIGSTDAAREATLNIVDRQWKQALTDPVNAWGDRFRQIVPIIGRVKDIRITDPEGGRKYAARVYEIDGTAIAEPDFGAPLPADLDAILTAASTIADYADLVGIWRDLFTKAILSDENAALQASAALSSTAFSGIGLHVIDPLGEDLGSVTIAVEDRETVVTPGDADDRVED